ncbi:hypothetical protein ACWDTQ_04125 [Streptomyces cellulosae]|uniref:hypothetical protein n=1 Tax=Streptomyces sp. enrichment culture TaxID=1795815 RepID=UPI003F566796
MGDLATIADMTARGITVDASEEAIVNQALAVASAAVRQAAGSNITTTTATVTLEGSVCPWLRLPGAPVTDVASVTVDGQPADDWRLVSGALWRAGGWSRGRPSAVTVTYSYGLPTAPADVVDLVCRMAARALADYRAGDPAARTVASERIGDYSVTYADADASSPFDLPDRVRARLAARFGSGAPLVVKSR